MDKKDMKKKVKAVLEVRMENPDSILDAIAKALDTSKSTTLVFPDSKHINYTFKLFGLDDLQIRKIKKDGSFALDQTIIQIRHKRNLGFAETDNIIVIFPDIQCINYLLYDRDDIKNITLIYDPEEIKKVAFADLTI
jgi:hypothetical protein